MSKVQDTKIRPTHRSMNEMAELIGKIQNALGTEEAGDALVEVAGNAHRAEIKLAVLDSAREDGLVRPGRAIEVLPFIDGYSVAIRGVGLLAFGRDELEELHGLIENEMPLSPEDELKRLMGLVAELSTPNEAGQTPTDGLLEDIIIAARKWQTLNNK